MTAASLGSRLPAVAGFFFSSFAALPATAGAPDLLDELQVGGLVQVDYQRRQISADELSDGTGEPLNEDRFLVRRARIQLAREWKHVGVFSITEFFANGHTVRPVGLDIHAQIPRKGEDEPHILQVRAGLIPIAFGLENYEQLLADRFFAERALFTDGFTPGRFDLGVSVEGQVLGIDWVVAAQNGEPIDTDEFAFLDPNRGKDLSARLRVEGELHEQVRASIGTSMIVGSGFSSGTQPTKDSFEWRDLNEDGRVLQSELVPIPGTAGRPSENYQRWGVGADAQLWAQIPTLGELHAYAEVGLGVNLDRGIAPADPVLLGRDQRSIGALVAVTQELTPYVTIGVRVEQYEPNVDSLELFDGITVVTRRRFRTLNAGFSLNHAMTETARARLLTELELQQNSLGRDNQGQPAQLNNGTLRVRAQAVF